MKNLMNRFFKRKIIQLRVSLCNRVINRITKKIHKLNKCRESAFDTRSRLVLAINNGKYDYEEIHDFEKSKSSQIVKIDYEVCAIQENINFLCNKIDKERKKIIAFNKSL